MVLLDKIQSLEKRALYVVLHMYLLLHMHCLFLPFYSKAVCRNAPHPCAGRFARMHISPFPPTRHTALHSRKAQGYNCTCIVIATDASLMLLSLPKPSPKVTNMMSGSHVGHTNLAAWPSRES